MQANPITWSLSIKKSIKKHTWQGVAISCAWSTAAQRTSRGSIVPSSSLYTKSGDRLDGIESPSRSILGKAVLLSFSEATHHFDIHVGPGYRVGTLPAYSCAREAIASHINRVISKSRFIVGNARLGGTTYKAVGEREITQQQRPFTANKSLVESSQPMVFEESWSNKRQ